MRRCRGVFPAKVKKTRKGDEYKRTEELMGTKSISWLLAGQALNTRNPTMRNFMNARFG